MKIYFLSSQPCALTFNGVFYGITDSFERSAELVLADRIYVKFSPEGALPIGFFVTENLLSSPPQGCEVYLLQDGAAIYACDFPPADFTLRPIAQKRKGDILATVYLQGKPQLSVNSAKGFFNAHIPPSFASCSIDFYENYILLKSKEQLGVYSLECQPLLVENVLEYELLGDVLHALLPLSDRLGRTADCEWNLKNGACILTKFTIRQIKQTDEALDENLLAYAFFESILLKADYESFLCDELLSDAPAIIEFLGEFLSVTLTNQPNVCGLVKRKAERLFTLDYVTVEIKNGKITDVRG